jgi:hypothetical protein
VCGCEGGWVKLEIKQTLNLNSNNKFSIVTSYVGSYNFARTLNSSLLKTYVGLNDDRNDPTDYSIIWSDTKFFFKKKTQQEINIEDMKP